MLKNKTKAVSAMRLKKAERSAHYLQCEGGGGEVGLVSMLAPHKKLPRVHHFLNTK